MCLLEIFWYSFDFSLTLTATQLVLKPFLIQLSNP